VALPANVTKVAAGLYYTCALLASNQVHALDTRT
jgi:hypothetical protein